MILTINDAFVGFRWLKFWCKEKTFTLNHGWVWDSGIVFDDEFNSKSGMVHISKDGIFTFSKGVQWPGFLKLPDGPLDDNKLPVTWEASLLFYIICDLKARYRMHFPIDNKQAATILRHKMVELELPVLGYVYYIWARLLGKKLIKKLTK
jgi:hypothetical protein